MSSCCAASPPRHWSASPARSSGATSSCAGWPSSATPSRTRSCRAWRSPICSRAVLLVGGLAAGLLVALAIGALSRRGRVREDTAIGVVFAGALALGVGLMSTIRTYSTDLVHVLFGNVLGVADSDIVLTAVLAGLVLLVVVLLYKELLLVSFDPIMASSVGMPVAWINSILLDAARGHDRSVDPVCRASASSRRCSSPRPRPRICW